MEQQEKITIDLSMTWEQATRQLVFVALNCAKGKEDVMLKEASKMGKKMDGICKAYEELSGKSEEG